MSAQHSGLSELGVDEGSVFVDHGATGTNRARPDVPEALAACRPGEHTTGELAEIFKVARSTVYRAVERAKSAEPGA